MLFRSGIVAEIDVCASAAKAADIASRAADVAGVVAIINIYISDAVCAQAADIAGRAADVAGVIAAFDCDRSPRYTAKTGNRAVLRCYISKVSTLLNGE